MNRRFAVIVATAMLVAAPAAFAKKDELPAQPGPVPTWATFRSLGEQSVLSKLIDPNSAQIEWPFGMAGGWWKPLFQKRVDGWFTCGWVNAKNRMGGYVGRTPFVVVVRDGAVVYSELGTNKDFDLLSTQCADAAKKGLFPSPASHSNDDGPKYGFHIKAVPEGFRIEQLAEGGPAMTAGLRQGDIITALNDIPLVGLPVDAIHTMLGAAEGESTFTVLGRGDIKMSKRKAGETQNSDASVSSATLGLRGEARADGFFITEVMMGSSAANAGIASGMTASHLNGIALKGFNATTLQQILSAAGSTAKLTLVGVGEKVLSP